MDKPVQYAQHFVKLEFMKARLEVFTNESACKGIDFIVKSKSGNYQEISLQTLNLETTERSIKILKSDWNYKLPENLWIALVLFMKEVEPAVYLIPSKVFKTPDQIFFNNEQEERHKHFSTWEIKIFTRGIKELARYGFTQMVRQIK